MLVEGTQQERDAYFAHLQDVYQQNKEALDAFWQRHPALKGDDVPLSEFRSAIPSPIFE
jgi:hypothetical protein